MSTIECFSVQFHLPPLSYILDQVSIPFLFNESKPPQSMLLITKQTDTNAKSGLLSPQHVLITMTAVYWRKQLCNLGTGISLQELDLLVKFDVVRAKFVSFILLQLSLLLQHHHLLHAHIKSTATLFVQIVMTSWLSYFKCDKNKLISHIMYTFTRLPFDPT